MTASRNQTLGGRHRLPTSPNSSPSDSSLTTKPRLPKPIPETPQPWTWRCICSTTNPIFKPRCLHCSRKVRTHDETIAEYEARTEKLRAVNQERYKLKNTPLEQQKGAMVGILENRARNLKKRGTYSQDFDYSRWSVYQSWRMACEAYGEMIDDGAVEGMQTVAARSARKEERKSEFARLRREKRMERKERLIHAAGHCERDCRWPGECNQVLRRVMFEEEKDSGSQTPEHGEEDQ